MEMTSFAFVTFLFLFFPFFSSPQNKNKTLPTDTTFSATIFTVVNCGWWILTNTYKSTTFYSSLTTYHYWGNLSPRKKKKKKVVYVDSILLFRFSFVHASPVWFGLVWFGFMGSGCGLNYSRSCAIHFLTHLVTSQWVYVTGHRRSGSRCILAF